MSKPSLRFRQVHPSWIKGTESRVTSQVFKPTPKDEKRLSVSLEELTTAEQAFQHHTQRLKLASAGVLAVTDEEVQSQGLAVVADPIRGPLPDPAHAYIDYTKVDAGNAIERKAKMLRAAARARGWVYLPPALGSASQEPLPEAEADSPSGGSPLPSLSELDER